MHQIAEPFIRRRAIRHMEKGRVVILAAGTGNPYFTTDTAAALRAAELDAEAILMAKNNVDGVYDDDPRRNPHATRYDILSYQVAIERNLRVMDASALTLCRDNDVPIIVFNVQEAGNIQRAARGDTIGTLVCSDPARRVGLTAIAILRRQPDRLKRSSRMIDEVKQDAEHRMQGALEALQRELSGIRTGRAAPALVERLHVDYYGASTPLNQLAGVSAPESRCW